MAGAWLYLPHSAQNNATLQTMQDLVFGLGKFLESTFDVLLVPFGMLPNYLWISIIGFGLLYWMFTSSKLTGKARREGGMV